MADVFISYSQKSRDSAKTLADTLQGKGFDVWWDDRLTSGDRFDDKIRDELMNADAVITIWTDDSIQSTYVRMEAGIAWAFDKLIPVRAAGLPPDKIPGPFRGLQADDVADIDRILRALAARDISARGPTTRKKLTKDDILDALRRIDSDLPGKLETWMRSCQDEGFRIDIRRSIMVKASIPNFGEINLGTLFPEGTVQTNYISESSERLGDPSIADDYLNGVATLIKDATVLRKGQSWGWHVEVFGALPKIADALSKGDEWIGLMKEARRRFTAAAAVKAA